jgi:D-aminopeptidase
MGRTGTSGTNGSGDLFIAFTTARANPAESTTAQASLNFLSSEQLDPLFEATVDSTEEAIINSILAAQTTVGHRGRSLEAIDHQWLSSFFE